MLIYPILFNINHGIEIYLKVICWSLNILTKINKKFEPTHDLMDLLEDTKELVNKFEESMNKIDTFNSWIKPLGKYLKELYII